MATATKPHLMHHLIVVAETEVRLHIEVEDGEKCFNRFTFLESLEQKINNYLDTTRPMGRFELNAGSMARWLWCHLALGSGDAPDGDTFRKMPILS